MRVPAKNSPDPSRGHVGISSQLGLVAGNANVIQTYAAK